MRAGNRHLMTASPRSNAIRGIVAGAIAGMALTIMCVLRSASWLVYDSQLSERAKYAALAALVAGGISVLTWKRIAIGPVLGLLASIGLSVWMLIHGQIVALALLGPMLIGGFWSALRAIDALGRQPRRITRI